MRKNETLPVERHKEMSISQLIEKCDKYFLSLRYGKWSMGTYRYAWSQLEKYAGEEGVTQFTASLGEDFIKHRYGVTKDTLKTEHQRNIFRAMRALSDFQQHGVIYRYGKRKFFEWPKQFEKLFKSHLEEYGKGVTLSTLERTSFDLERFAAFLDANGVKDFRDLSVSDIHSFTASLQQYTQYTIANVMIRVRVLCAFAYKNGYHDKDMSLHISNIRCLRNRYVPTTYNKDEIERMLNAVDRGNGVGKRDYAILILAVKLGMRAGDIRDLQLEDLKWETNRIEFTQRKTNQPVSLPMLEEIGLALIDYLRLGRPQAASKNIFISHIMPYEGFGVHNSMYRIMSKYLKLANVKADDKQKGLHALRHSLASTLLEGNTPLPVISEILGHVDTNTTGIYLKVDLNGLRRCALEVKV